MMKVWVMSLAVVSVAAVAMAEEPTPWSLEDGLREAYRRNPDLIAAQAAVRKAKAAYFGSYSAFLPQVSGTLSTEQGTSKPHAGGSSSLDETSLGLSASETLFSGFGNEANVRQQRANLYAAEAALAAAKAQVGFDVSSAFARLLYAQEHIMLTEQIAARRGENARLIEMRYQAGREHQGSLLRSQAAHQQAVFDVSQAKRALGVAQQEVAKTLGRRDGTSLRITGELTTVAIQESPDFVAVMSQTPAHRQAEAEAQGASAAVAVARSGFFPTVSATGSLGRSGNDWPPRDDRWLGGVVVSLPLFSGGQTWFDVQRATAERYRVEANLKSTDDQTVAELKSAYAAYQDAAGQVSVQAEFLHAAQVREEIATSQYTNGLLSFQDWDLIEDDLIANQKTMLTTRRDAVIARATWERLQGKSPEP